MLSFICNLECNVVFTMSELEVILGYKGEVAFETIDLLLGRLKKLPEYQAIRRSLQKRVYSIFIECMENIYKHKITDSLNVNEKTFSQMRQHYEKAGVWLREPIMKMVPDPIEYDKYGSKDFFLWFKDFNFKSKANDHWFHRVIYNTLPYSLANIYDNLLKKMNIEIHPDCYSIKHYSYLFRENNPKKII